MMTSRLDDGESMTSQALLSTRIYGVLRHYEAPILHLQRLLVWEKCFQSAVFVALAHVCFGYACLRCNHVSGIFFFMLLLLVWVDMWKHKIWPEIRAIAPDIDSEWGELNPRLLSVKEMCDYLAQFGLNIKSFVFHLLVIRSTYPGRFCAQMCALCLVLMIIGGKVPGAMIVYVSMMFCILTPLFIYHRLPQHLYIRLQPFIDQFQYTFQQRPGNNFQLAQSIASERSLQPADDRDIEDFVPMLDEYATAELAKAVNPEAELSEDEHVHGLPEVADMLNRNQNNTEPFWNTHTDSEPEHDDVIELPHTNPMLPSAPARDFQSAVVNEMTSAVGELVKEGISSMAQTMQRPILNIYPDLAKVTDSKASTPTSDYEFIVLDSEDED